MAIEELKFLIKKQNCENIIKIKAFSYKINSLKHVTRFFIIMEKYTASLNEALEQPKLFDLLQKLEIAIQITIGLISLHSGEFRLSHNDL
jgi:hypothetical protein